MATKYTRENFTPDAVPSAFKKDVAVLVAQAVSLGWDFLVKADNTATLVAPPPNEHQNIHLSTRRNSGPLRRLGTKVMKFADPALLEQADAPAEPAVKITRDVKGTILAAEEIEPVTEPIIKWEDPDPPKPADFTLVKEGPMISMGANDKPYESDIATERHWSDGTVTFHCVHCDFEGKTPRGMAAHQKKHAVVTRKPVKTTPVDSLADALVKRMEAGLDWIDLHDAAHELAEAATAWGVCRSEAEIKRCDEDAALLNQIRTLVGVSPAEAAEVEELRRKVTTLTIQVEAERAEAERAAETLQAARDLFNEATS